ncbi:glycosyltransferase [Agromyces humatus]|uniref:Glycosyltransferase n=1 Tax=Agromyces humatus TaxID=279573 RepID=A0ABN2K6I8_9MICO|nr:glycosyltransferase [Agromyces humatus]
MMSTEDSRGGAARRAAAGVPARLKPFVRENFERFANELGRWPTAEAALRRRQRIHGLISSGLIDREYYSAQAGRVFTTDAEVAEHYVSTGSKAGLVPSPLVENEWFASKAGRRGPAVLSILFDATIPMVEVSPVFDTARYARETRAGFRTPLQALQHFLANAGPDTLLPVSPQIEALIGDRRWRTVRRALIDEAVRLQKAVEYLAPRLRPASADDVERSAAFLASSRAEARSRPKVEPLVSVIMPVKNRAHRLDESVRSVQRQTYANWELVIVDDGSVDATPAVLAEWAALEPRIRVVLRESGGVSAARNTGIGEAGGEVVAFLDSDNAWSPEFLEVAVGWMSRHDEPFVHTALLRHAGSAKILYQGAQTNGFEQLLEGGNSVDLNALVVRADLLHEIGGFDESLRRWVDYDLALRLSRLAQPKFIPFIGVHYDDMGDGDERISTTESPTWEKAVLEKFLCEWDVVESHRDERVPGRVSVVVRCDNHVVLLFEALADLFAQAADEDIEVVVVANGSKRAVATAMAGAFAGNERIKVVHHVRRHTTSLEANTGFVHSTGQYVCFLETALRGSGDWLQRLRRELDEHADLGAAQPLIIAADGTLENAGIAFGGPYVVPWSNLRGHPVEDALLAGAQLDVAAASDFALFVRATSFIAARGFDVVYGNSLADADLGIRLAAIGARSSTLTTARAQVRPKQKLRSNLEGFGAARLLDAHGALLPSPDHSLFSLLGAEVRGHEVGEQLPGVLARAGGPIVVRERSDRRQRWAIKTAAPAGVRGDTWGDTLFAEDLAEALRARGHLAHVDRREAVARPSAHLDDVVLVLRGLDKVAPQPGAVNIMWVISHPELVTAEEINTYDLVYAASSPWAEQATRRFGREVLPLLQATNARRFNPARRSERASSDTLFVGATRRTYRPIVRWANDVGADLSIFGPGWQGLVDAANVKDTSLAGEQVGEFYASARVVLNDHWRDMADQGFISNRIFDAVGAGAWVVSDQVEGLDELFGESVQVVGDREELRNALFGADVRPDDETLMRGSSHVLEHHTFDARAEHLITAAQRLRAER